MIHPTNPSAVRVKRDNAQGWHWVADFDPAIHTRFDDAPAEPKARTRKPKEG